MADEEKISDRRLGEVEEQETIYSPAAYGLMDPAVEGRWTLLGGGAMLWTDDANGAGVLWLRQTDLTQGLWRHFQLAKSAGVPAGVAYQLAVVKAGPSAAAEKSGPLSGAADQFSAAMGPS
jgi:hypothetical protein